MVLLGTTRPNEGWCGSNAKHFANAAISGSSGGGVGTTKNEGFFFLKPYMEQP